MSSSLQGCRILHRLFVNSNVICKGLRKDIRKCFYVYMTRNVKYSDTWSPASVYVLPSPTAGTDSPDFHLSCTRENSPTAGCEDFQSV